MANKETDSQYEEALGLYLSWFSKSSENKDENSLDNAKLRAVSLMKLVNFIANPNQCEDIQLRTIFKGIHQGLLPVESAIKSGERKLFERDNLYQVLLSMDYFDKED